jgi:mRNA interferase MazF
MKKYEQGDIVLLPFPFTDGTSSKVRPSVLLANSGCDGVFVFITSKKDKDEVFEIKMNKCNNLKSDSYIRYTKIATIQNSLIIGKLGQLTASELKNLKSKIKTFLKI